MIAAGAVVAVLGLGAAAGNAAPGDTNTTLNVVGEPYAKAVAILRAQGVASVFGGSVGSDVPQAQCVVASQKVLGTTRKMQLNLDCSAEAQPLALRGGRRWLAWAICALPVLMGFVAPVAFMLAIFFSSSWAEIPGNFTE